MNSPPLTFTDLGENMVKLTSFKDQTIPNSELSARQHVTQHGSPWFFGDSLKQDAMADDTSSLWPIFTGFILGLYRIDPHRSAWPSVSFRYFLMFAPPYVGPNKEKMTKNG